MHKSHVIKLYPTESQEVFFVKSCGVARFSYNWALENWKKKYENAEKTSAYSLVKELNSIKKKEFSWMMEVGKCAPQYAIHNLESAFKNFFKKNAKYPRFKKKGKKDSFVSIGTNKEFKQKDNKIWVSRLGWVKCAENLRFEGKVNNVVIKRVANMWFAVVNIDTQSAPVVSENQAIVGVDLGIKSLAVTSDGEVFENPKSLKSNMRRLKIRQRRLSKKAKGSKNRKKQITCVGRLHYKISCIRKNALHEATTKIVNKAGIIVLEDLNVSGMMKNHSLAQAINDVSFGEFRRQIEYKAAWQGKKVIVAYRFFASSKTCSCCGCKKAVLKLSERIFKCESCGVEIDRDLNAAKNLANYGSTAKCAESNAFGVGNTLPSVMIANSPAMNEEVNKINTLTI